MSHRFHHGPLVAQHTERAFPEPALWAVLSLLAVLLAIGLAGCANPSAAAVAPRTVMALGPVTRTVFQGCDAPTPVLAPDGAVYSNVSDCSPAGTRVSTAWVRLDPTAAPMKSGFTATGSGAAGRKLSGAVVDGGTLYVIERNLTRSGGLRVGRSASVSAPAPSWAWSTPDFGWASFAQASPDGYQYVYLRDSVSAYGTADRVDLARVPAGAETTQAAWELFAGDPAAPAWVPWADRAARAPVLTDPGRINRPHASYLGGCWTMAVTMPSTSRAPGNGLAVYTSVNPYGPWNRRYYVSGVDLGESAQLSPLWPGQLLTTKGDRFEWHAYTMPDGC